jgi:DNA polymerase
MKTMTISYLHLDFESRGVVELRGKESVGIYNYMNHPQTDMLMLGWGFTGEPKQLWRIYSGDPMPETLQIALHHPEQLLTSFNTTFERYGLKYKLGIDTPIERWHDTQASAQYLSMPGDLDDVVTIMRLPRELAKDKRGKALIELFSLPKTRRKKGQPTEIYFNDWNSHPKEWREFEEYCVQDVRAEEEVGRREGLLGAFPLPPLERKIWMFDQKVNDRGMPVDLQFVQTMYKMALRSKKEALDAQNALTGLDNANSRDQLLPWVKERGYPYNTLRKETVDSALKDPALTIAPEARQALIARREATSTTYTKLAKIMQQVSPDGMLRNQFVYCGSARNGRWSSRGGVQLHNLARPGVIGKSPETPEGYDFELRSVVNEARQMIQREDYEGIKTKYKSVLLVVKNLIRTVFSVENI